jgi:hypothetical protein
MSIEEIVKNAVREVVREELGNVPMHAQRLYTREQAAHYLGTNIATIDRLRASGQLPTMPMKGRGIKRDKPLIDIRDLDRYVEENKRSGDAA